MGISEIHAYTSTIRPSLLIEGSASLYCTHSAQDDFRSSGYKTHAELRHRLRMMSLHAATLVLQVMEIIQC